MSQRYYDDYDLEYEDVKPQTNLEVITIPPGTRLNLWDNKKKTITDTHFVSHCDIHVLILAGHGPLYKYLHDMINPSNKQEKNDLSKIWNETKETLKGLPMSSSLVKDNLNIDHAIDALMNRYEIHDHVDAILMGYKNNGDVGLYFIDHGNKFDISMYI